MNYKIVLLFILLFFGATAQEDFVWMRPNKGQWNARINYQVDFFGGNMYIENDGFKYQFFEQPKSHTHEANNSSITDSVKAHVVATKFIGSNWAGELQESDLSTHYSNYFLGNNEAQWKSAIFSVGTTKYLNFYPGIDLEMKGGEGDFKYSFFVAPGNDPSIIQMNIEGADKVFIDEKGNLHLVTSLGEVMEKAPLAYTLDNGAMNEVKVNFKLQNNVVSYSFPNGYDHSQTLVIDPSLVFSTFTGSTADNWGMTATPGPNGEMYAGGICFGIGYPVTTGAFDVTYNGGTANTSIPGFDIAISKFNETGNQLLFSTYLGGNSNELPESMMSGTNGDLYILGISSSPNYPISSGAYDNSFNGGPVVSQNDLKLVGSDIVITKFSPNGQTLLASTFLGGQGTDGLNATSLYYNYGDQFRGEIILDGAENVFIASHTTSTDFPVSNGSSLQGAQDAVACKLNANLSQLVWSTYLGGSGLETGNSMELASNGEVFICGGTTSPNMLFNGVDNTYGGVADGYLIKLNGTNGSFIKGTYMGDAEYDQTYFVKLDIDDKVYVYGQTESSWAITPGCYGNPNSGQFLRQYSNDLSVINWTTMFGAGTGHVEISPTAFLVSDCYDIFVAGWGGYINTLEGAQALQSTTSGFPITIGAYQPSTNGSNFYLGILGNDATSLIYGTYMGGTASSYNHVDGGTSRFDKSGAVYHAVCAACGGNDNGFTSTPGSWSPTNQSSNCNLAAFKFQLGEPYSLSANSTVCNGEPFQLNASGGISYTWSPAASLSDPHSPNPIATPTVTTVYYVDMDFNEGCAIVDSVIVTVINEPDLSLNTVSTICYGDTATIVGTGGGLTYSWSPNQNIDNTTTSTVHVWPSQSQYYYCTVTNECFDHQDSVYVTVRPIPDIILTNDTIICKGSNAILNGNGALAITWQANPTLSVINPNQASVHPNLATYYFATGTDGFGCVNKDSVLVSIYPVPPLIISNDTSICLGSSALLNVSGANSYVWSPQATLTQPNTASPTATPAVTTTYYVDASYAMGCVLKDSVKVTLLYLPNPVLPDTVNACYGVSKPIQASGATTYQWSPGTYLDQTTGPLVHATAFGNITYNVGFTNVCGTVYEDVVVIANSPSIKAFNDTIVCPGNPANLYATGGLTYNWTPITGLSSVHSSSTIAIPTSPTVYKVYGTDKFGCLGFDSVFVDLFPQPFIQASIDQYLFEGESAQLSATSITPGPYEWSPSEYLSCINCIDPVASPPTDYLYTVSYTDENGCRDADQVWIYFKPLIWVPNTFTPDGTGFNDFFQVKGGNVRAFKLMIFNRWGELVITLNDISESWDGTYKGNKCQDGTYTWKLYYEDLKGNKTNLAGHVNLLR